MYSDSGAVARPREVKKITQLNHTTDGVTMPGMYTDMQDSPADALRRDLFESRTDEGVLLATSQQ
jgi:hypothetical protein